ncbi:NUDIX hydrolase [Ochrobactrum sp. POC9]|uniref:NUDIX domain-containing protein n=1 Tax=unclassified Ochrobactrum TaxID=239106 RepID=UPI000D705F13|nr:NUDIX domain-containing protein [Ochrobactrum sp. POC9]MCH4541468.1 NUDIX hydrolase [Ochrobactrum sp. A-1]PWU71635.1 NUDIX hydrolase [Ochrobactrum sp. POC9]
MKQVRENTVHIIGSADVRVLSGPLLYAVENSDAIASNWTREQVANPTLFDGEFYLAPQAELTGSAFQAGFKRTSFATLMHWRHDESQERPWHIFGVGVIVSSDGHLIAGRMSAQNAGAGRVYFPAGSVDDNDIVDGYVDYDANRLREVREETGLDLLDARAEQQVNLVTGNRSIALFRRYYFDVPSKELVLRIEQHLSAEEEPELSEIITVKAAGVMGEATPSYVRAFADWHFNNL